VTLVTGADGLARCWWCVDDPGYVDYHDREWGRPVRDELRLFEKLCLEGFQAGLSWLTILRKRAAFREVFAGFDPERVAAFGERDVERLLGDARIVRNRAKIEATAANARALLAMHGSGETLSDLVWSHAPEPCPRPTGPDDLAAETTESRALSRALRARGFRFVGPTTLYALMQACGVVDDHLAGCHVPPTRRGAAGADLPSLRAEGARSYPTATPPCRPTPPPRRRAGP
jgi:DNA-3-methyladenine glycosylase I